MEPSAAPPDLRRRHRSCVTGATPERLAALPGVQLDPRTGVHRAEARHYRAIVEHLRRDKIPYHDEARAYQPTPWPLRTSRDPFPHQTEALKPGGRQAAAASSCCRPAPARRTSPSWRSTRPAGPPWSSRRPSTCSTSGTTSWSPPSASPVGLLGGGYYDIQPLTVTTYDSAYIHLERWGNRFGLLVFDECHHLPGPTYVLAAIGSIAPFRLGLTATPERADGQEALLPELIGPIVYRREIKQLAGEFLAEYRTRAALRRAVAGGAGARTNRPASTYRRFVDERGISMGGATRLAALHPGDVPLAGGPGRLPGLPRAEAHLPWPRRPSSHLLEQLLEQHRGDRVLIFTLRQRHGLPDRPPVPGAGHHAPDQDEGAAAHPGGVPRRRPTRSW